MYHFDKDFNEKIQWCISKADFYAYQAYITADLKRSYTLRNHSISTEIKSIHITRHVFDEISIKVLVWDMDLESCDIVNSSIYLTFMLVKGICRVEIEGNVVCDIRIQTSDEISKNYTLIEMPKIKKVLYKNPATIVFWTDGSKTVIKCQKNDKYDPEKGLAMAILKKINGNTGYYYNEFKKWLPKKGENDNVRK